MSRIADAQLKLGRTLVDDAAAAWDEGQRIAGRAHADAPRTERFRARPSIARHDTAVRLTPAGARSLATDRVYDPDADSEIAALLREVCAAPPVGAGARSVLFCACDAAAGGHVAEAFAARALAERPGSRIVLITITNDAHRPATVEGLVVERLEATAEQASQLVADVSAVADLTIVDASVRSAGADIVALGCSVDAVVVLVAENATRREAAQSMVAAFRRASAKLLGAVLTNRSYPIPKRIYERL